MTGRLIVGAQAILEAEFGRASLIIPNGIDCHRFTPGPRSTRQPSKTIHCTPDGAVPLPPPPFPH